MLGATDRRTLASLTALAALALMASALPARHASAAAPACGVDCSNPGRIVLCNDGLGPGSNIFCGAQAADFEAFCGSFDIGGGTGTNYPLILRNIWVMTGPADPFGPQFDLEVFEETGVPSPGARIAPNQANSYQIPGDPTRFARIGLESALNAYTVQTGAFRVCLRRYNIVGESNNVCTDANGLTANRNWLDIFYMGSRTRAWYSAATVGLPGDFLIRPEVEVQDLRPWQAGGVCQNPDGGVAADSGPPPADAAPADLGHDGGVVVADAAAAADVPVFADAAPDAAVGPDAVAADALPLADAAAPDAVAPVDSGVDAGLPPPTITTISPDNGRSDSATDVVVIGGGFVAGVRVQIGTIMATVNSVPGPTTILARVPANIVPGVYDVLVQNPDGQAAVLPRGFRVNAAPGADAGPVVTDSGAADAAVIVAADAVVAADRPVNNSEAPAEGGCSCKAGARTTAGADAPLGALLLIALGLAGLFDVRRRSRRARHA